jgi:hypothetical protein
MTDVQESAVMVDHADAVGQDASLPSLPPPPPSSPLEHPQTVPLSAAPSNCPSPDTTLHEIADALPVVAENNPFAQSWTCAGRMEELDKKCQTLATLLSESMIVNDLNRNANTSLQQRIEALEICSNNDTQKIKTNEQKTSFATGMAIVGVMFGAVALVRTLCK